MFDSSGRDCLFSCCVYYKEIKSHSFLIVGEVPFEHSKAQSHSLFKAKAPLFSKTSTPQEHHFVYHAFVVKCLFSMV